MITSLPNILLVDDIEVNLILLETALRKEQANIHKATSGENALKLTEQNEYALIILDVSMPIMNGFELATYIRKQSLNTLTPIIFISAILFDEFSISQGYRSGAVDYLAKPYHHQVLISKVRVFLQLYNQKQELQQQRITLQESNDRYREVQETLKLKLQLEKAVSLASARFSGNFDLDNSIHFMLRDIANVCNAPMASFFSQNGNISTTYQDGSLSTKLTSELSGYIRNAINKAFIDSHDNAILISFNDLKGPWNPHTINADSFTIAVRVAAGEKLFGYIIVHNSSGMSGWNTNEVNSLTIFGTITGNALERNETRKALIESEFRYRSYIENAPEGIVVTDQTGDIKEYNEAFSKLFGPIPKSDKPDNILNILGHKNESGYYPEFSNLLNGKLSCGEYSVTIENQTRLIKAQSVRLPAKQYLIFCTDITTERELEKHIIQTERMVAIGEMATGIAHEINQPLNTISFGIDNLFQALQSNKADEAYVKEKSNKIFGSIHRMRSIIDHVRNFARGNDDVILSSFPISEPVDNALSLYTEQLKDHGIHVIKKLNDNTKDVLIYGNTYKIEQVLINLLSNARDSMEEKKSKQGTDFLPSLQVKAEVVNNMLTVTISDNGMGMNSEQLANITKPFYTSKAPGKGTGLGLAISQNIVLELKGVLSFHSIPDEGTSVKVELPVITAKTS